MTDKRTETPGEHGGLIPRDMPDQQAQDGDDPWDVVPAGPSREAGSGGEGEADPADSADGPQRDAEGVPGTDEAGTGPRGAPRKGTVHPEHPGPQESPA
ncbi:hypothetical protein [Streptomyces fructofermentans]|uniref:Uncharacterized protein n=1 Tax=Streptomyces fructofermentans TaxID=152141 RepID=A0A918U4L4_9ACTN|nr:hypothetical protein [Streptomyces fructofermentans]GGX90530.1 hypothetical protein GCM10010515_67080 [Streptomyces fructofermentans]